uniref:Rho guanine nucleotide exchange factor 6-like n=1 Tax=Sinocyclocheilus grahami TaxID=75366 RepID=A0A672PKM7_SINGR
MNLLSGSISTAKCKPHSCPLSIKTMNPEEQTVTWLITLGVLNSPKKNIADPEEFLKTSLRDGVVLCKLVERVLPGATLKYSTEPRCEADCIANIREFLKGCQSLKVEGFDPESLYTGENFNKVLNTEYCMLKFFTCCCCVQEMSENGGGGQLVVKARFNFKQNNEDELSFSKGELIHVTRQEEGGWWEGTLNGKTGWFPSNYVREVKPCEKPISPKAVKGLDVPQLTKNYYNVVKDILSFQQGLCLALEECSNEDLDKFMESQGASAPGILTLTTSLSKPFMRLDKYPILLQELERHVEEAHPDYSDILKATVAFKYLVIQCQDLRKRKNLELQILSEPVRGWEGDNMKSLGQVVYMSQVHIQSSLNEEKEERYFMLFPNVVVMLSASPRMSGFIYQGRLPLTGTTVTKLPEDAETGHYAFEITGGAIDRTMVFCSSAQEQLEWLEHLHAYTKEGSPSVDGKPTTMAGTSSHHLHSFGTAVANRGPLEPPKITKPWSLSCLRPAPPLKPSAALGYKERMSYILKDSSKSPRPRPKFLPKRKTERKPSDDEFLIRKSTAALEEDAQILKVIEAYCTGASLHQSTTAVRKECIPQVLLPEEEKIIVEEIKSNGQTIIEGKSLVDAVYALKDEVHELKKENKWMKQCLEEEQKSRKEIERIVRKMAKQKNDWDEGGH